MLGLIPKENEKRFFLSIPDTTGTETAMYFKPAEVELSFVLLFLKEVLFRSTPTK